MPSHYFLPTLDVAEFIKVLMNHATDGILLTDATGKVLAVNKSYSELFHVNRSEILGRKVQDLVAEGHWSPNLFQRVVQQKKSLSVVQTTRKGNSVLSTGTPIFDGGGDLRYVLFNDRDMSLQSLLEEGLSSSVEVAVNADTKSEHIMEANERYTLNGIVVKSGVMKKQLNLALKVAKYPVPILLTGESGVGKSMIARFIHDQSPWREGPFVAINCGAIPDTLVESELFGHTEGSFTGASSGGKRGRIEAANGGTLFLDEISELPYVLQVKLLQFLETKQIYPVGSTKAIPVDCTIIAATNTDLSTMIRNKKFREDLYYRLNGIPIHLPPLRERQEDIRPLARYFLEQYSTRFGLQMRLTDAAYEELQRMDFYGNVRELSHLIQRLVVTADGESIEPEDVQHWAAVENGQVNMDEINVGTLSEQVKIFEKEVIRKAVSRYGSQEEAAKVLGVHQSTLSRKL